jgi:hypothetical protein
LTKLLNKTVKTGRPAPVAAAAIDPIKIRTQSK